EGARVHDLRSLVVPHAHRANGQGTHARIGSAALLERMREKEIGEPPRPPRRQGRGVRSLSCVPPSSTTWGPNPKSLASWRPWRLSLSLSLVQPASRAPTRTS